MESIIAEIESHTKEVKAGRGEKGISCCQRCFGKAEKFQHHDCRRRQLRVVVENFVRVITTRLLRLMCPLCKKTFTVYPRFVLPRKHYVRGHLEQLSKIYLDKPEQSYRKVVTVQGTAIGYAELSAGQIDERQLSPSTVWRCLSFLGSLTETLSQAQRLIREKAPETSFFRNLIPIIAKKYRSTKRKYLLETAQKLLGAAAEFKKYFGYGIFPHFATACRWK